MPRLVWLCFFCTVQTAGQSAMQWHLALGNTLYFGDLGNERYFPYSEIHYGFSAGMSHRMKWPSAFHSLFQLEANATWLRIAYDETQPLPFSRASGLQLRNFLRGLNFRNDLIGGEGRVLFYLPSFNYRPEIKQWMSIYFFAGIGLFHSNPRADLFRGAIHLANRYYQWSDGTLRNGPEGQSEAVVVQRDGKYETTLRHWLTEGQSRYRLPGQKKIYSLLQLGIPHGGGFRFVLTRETSVRLEFAFYDFLTDYLDDVSHRYATYTEIARNFPADAERQELAKYITDPSGRGSDGFNGPFSSPRGNPKKFDWVFFFNLRLSTKIDGSPALRYKLRTPKQPHCPHF